MLVHNYLSRFFEGIPGQKVLELNCGTGVDAIWMAKKGQSVLATDISGSMIQITGAKAEKYGLDKQISSRVCSFDNIASLKGAGPFNLVFSNFGGLNCIDPKSIENLSQNLREMLKPGGSFIAVLMPRMCWWESLYFLLKRQLDQAFRRKSGGPVEANLNGGKVMTWYYDPDFIAELCQKHFKIKNLHPIGIALPPSYMDKIFSKRPRLLNWLSRCENYFHNRPYLAKWSDHYLIHLEAN